jgi:hypothetical protein
MFLRMLAFAVGLAALTGPALTDAKTYQRIPVEPTASPPSTLAQFIAKLQNAGKEGNASVILQNVSKDFRCLRDFGGTCNDGMTGRDKFSAVTGLSAASDEASKSAALSRLSPLLLSRSIESTTAHGATDPILCSPAVPKFDQGLAATVDKTVFGAKAMSFSIGSRLKEKMSLFTAQQTQVLRLPASSLMSWFMSTPRSADPKVG